MLTQVVACFPTHLSQRTRSNMDADDPRGFLLFIAILLMFVGIGAFADKYFKLEHAKLSGGACDYVCPECGWKPRDDGPMNNKDTCEPLVAAGRIAAHGHSRTAPSRTCRCGDACDCFIRAEGDGGEVRDRQGLQGGDNPPTP